MIRAEDGKRMASALERIASLLEAQASAAEVSVADRMNEVLGELTKVPHVAHVFDALSAAGKNQIREGK